MQVMPLLELIQRNCIPCSPGWVWWISVTEMEEERGRDGGEWLLATTPRICLHFDHPFRIWVIQPPHGTPKMIFDLKVSNPHQNYITPIWAECYAISSPRSSNFPNQAIFRCCVAQETNATTFQGTTWKTISRISEKLFSSWVHTRLAIVSPDYSEYDMQITDRTMLIWLRHAFNPPTVTYIHYIGGGEKGGPCTVNHGHGNEQRNKKKRTKKGGRWNEMKKKVSLPYSAANKWIAMKVTRECVRNAYDGLEGFK